MAGDSTRGQAERLAQLRPAALIIVRAQEAIEVDRGVLGFLPLAEMSDGGQSCRPGGPASQPNTPPSTQPTGSPTVSTTAAERIALRRGSEIGPLHKGARRDAPDEQGLAKIAGLLRQSPAVATSNRPPRPKVELKTKRSSVMAAAPKRPCRMSLPKMRGSWGLSSKSRKRLSGAGAAPP